MFKGKNCFITGASRGIGLEISKKFASLGCNLFLTATDEEKLKEIKDELSKYDIEVYFEVGDLNIDSDYYKIISSVRKEFKNIDILINCAGVFSVKSLQESTIEEYNECFNVNMKSIFIFSKEFSKDMINNKWGRIINIGSSSSYSGFKDTSVYCASKHALLGFSRSLHNELKEHNIRVYSVSPGSVKTDMGKLVKNQDFETFINPKDVAEYVTFISSFDSEIISEEIRLNRMRTQ